MAAKETLKTQLNKADLLLKSVERWTQRATIIATIATVTSTAFGVYLSVSQNRLFRAQVIEAVEKERVSFSFRLSPVILPTGDKFYIHAKLRNLSTKRLTLMMVTIRAWKGDKWHDAISLDDSSGAALVSDNLVVDCDTNFCKPELATGKLRLRNLPGEITLEPTEGDSEFSFGPYPITPSELNQGFWIEGWAYVSETDQGSLCAVDTLDTPSPGLMPYVCDKKTVKQAKCYEVEGASCSGISAPPTFYSKVKLIKLSQ